MTDNKFFPIYPITEIMNEVQLRGVATRGYLDPDAVEALTSWGYKVEEVWASLGEVAHYRVTSKTSKGDMK